MLESKDIQSLVCTCFQGVNICTTCFGALQEAQPLGIHVTFFSYLAQDKGPPPPWKIHLLPGAFNPLLPPSPRNITPRPENKYLVQRRVLNHKIDLN